MKDILNKKRPIPGITFVIICILSLCFVVQSSPVDQLRYDTTPETLESVDLLIIAPKDFVSLLQPLVSHKEKMGVKTHLVTLCEICDQMFWEGIDCAEKIKYFIKNAYDTWDIKYVLLIGGKKGQTSEWYLPVRYVEMDDNWESRYISDLYFADLYDSEHQFSSWDSDNDGRYGEWYYEQPAEDVFIDLYPEVSVGRLPCRSKIEVKIMVDKIITYETSTYGQPWFHDLICVAGDTYLEFQNPNWTGYEGEQYSEQVIETMTGFTPTRLFTSDGSFSSERDVIQSLNQGCGFVYFNGHGNPQTWGNHPPNDEEFITGLTTKSMVRLQNGNKLPICIVGGCHNSQFDVSLMHLLEGLREDGLGFFEWKFFLKEWVPECWGWTMTRKLGGGSVATIGCSALGYTKEDKESFVGGLDQVEAQFFQQYRHHNKTILGDAWAAAITLYLDHYPIDWYSDAVSDSWIDTKIVQSWVLFGDPSLQIGGYPSS